MCNGHQATLINAEGLPEVINAACQRLHSEAPAIEKQHAVHVVLAVLKCAAELMFDLAPIAIAAWQRESNL